MQISAFLVSLDFTPLDAISQCPSTAWVGDAVRLFLGSHPQFLYVGGTWRHHHTPVQGSILVAKFKLICTRKIQKVIVLLHLPPQTVGIPLNTTSWVPPQHHALRSQWHRREQEHSQVRDWAQKAPWIARIQDWTLNQPQVLCSNPQTILPPLFSPGSLTITLLYFGLIPIAKSSRSVSNPADEMQIILTWQHMIHSVWLHSGQERGLHRCKELFMIV